MERLERRIALHVKHSRRNVFLRDDFAHLCTDYDQIGRALGRAVRAGSLARLGHGLYAKVRVSSVTGRPILAKPLPELGREALSRLQVKVYPTRAEREYRTGASTQVPTGRVVGVKERISRKIKHGDVELRYERV
jgi:hypothetical protein